MIIIGTLYMPAKREPTEQLLAIMSCVSASPVTFKICKKKLIASTSYKTVGKINCNKCI